MQYFIDSKTHSSSYFYISKVFFSILYILVVPYVLKLADGGNQLQGKF